MRARDRDRPACTLSCSRGFLQELRDPCFESLVTRVDRGDQRSVLLPQCVMGFGGFGILESHILFIYFGIHLCASRGTEPLRLWHFRDVHDIDA